LQTLPLYLKFVKLKEISWYRRSESMIEQRLDRMNTYTNEAIMVTESENTRGDRAVLFERLNHGVVDYLLHVRTRSAVKPILKPPTCATASSSHRNGKQAPNRGCCADNSQHVGHNWSMQFLNSQFPLSWKIAVVKSETCWITAVMSENYWNAWWVKEMSELPREWSIDIFIRALVDEVWCFAAPFASGVDDRDASWTGIELNWIAACQLALGSGTRNSWHQWDFWKKVPGISPPVFSIARRLRVQVIAEERKVWDQLFSFFSRVRISCFD